MLYGFSIASFQYEEMNNNSDWYAWVTDPTNLFLNKVSGELPTRNYYISKYSQIHDLALKVNANAWRLSFSWEKLVPKKDKISTEYLNLYRKILKDLKDKGFKIFACLNHFVLPLWLHDPIKARESLMTQGPLGWFDKSIIDEFLKFSLLIYDNFSEYIDYICTFNEPNNMIDFGYLAGYFPPGITSNYVAEKVRNNVIEAHNKVYEELSRKGAKVGIVYMIPAIQGEDNVKKEAEKRLIWDFLDKIKIDWIGVNYYSRIKLDKKGIPLHGYGFFCEKDSSSLDGNPTSDYGWEVYPEGITQVLESVKRIEKPIYVTENGVADEKDYLRPRFILDHLNAIKSSRVKVEGYFHWSLLDNYEWNFGYNMKFGLYDINMNPRPSAYIFKEITFLT